LDPEDVAAAATFPSYFDAGSDEEEAQVPVPSKKPTGTTSKSSKKKPDQVETEYKKASDHPDVANKVEKSRKRGTTEGPEESVNSPKKVNPSCLSAIETKADGDRLDSQIFLLAKLYLTMISTATSAPSLRTMTLKMKLRINPNPRLQVRAKDEVNRNNSMFKMVMKR
jgi:hypothetical protein